MRPLLIDDVAKRKAQAVLDYALTRAHWYRPGKSTQVPGDDPNFVVHLNTYRCVFTITQHSDGFVMRHLTVSVPGELYPSIVAVFMIAELFGFHGWDGKTVDRLPENWMAQINKAEQCVVLAQPYEEARATT
jgi:hypothetical protein